MMNDNIEKVLANIDKSAAQAGVDPNGITLVAVSKTKPVSQMLEAYDAGLRFFGENRVQEFLEKKDKMPGDVKWNIIGRLQTNKVKYIINNIWLLHSLDRIPLAVELQKQCEKNGCGVNALMEVNVSGEDSKSGFSTDEINGAAEEIARLKNIRILGLMTIAPYTNDKMYLRNVFARTKKLFDTLTEQKYDNFDFKYLSMGMSNDYCEAVLEGANMVRVGSALFGDRG